MRRVRAETMAASLLRNGDFEQSTNGLLEGWSAQPNGYFPGPGQGRNGSQALRCEASAVSGSCGAGQTITLARTNVLPLVVRGWSKALNVSGSPGSGYSLYVDIIYADGTPWWGQTANFRTGTHDWQAVELTLCPEKPVKTLTVHCLFRGHSGTVWFDDVSVQEVRAGAGAYVFQGSPMTVAGQPAKGRGKEQTLRTGDGLELAMRDNTVSSLRVGGRELAGNAPSGFLARDVAADSDVYAFSQGACSELGLTLQSKFSAESNRIVVQGRVTDTTGRARAISLFFALPLEAAGWRWGEDIRRSRMVEGNPELANTVSVRCGATGSMSLYPLAALYNQREGVALALDMAQPAIYRLVYHAGTRQFFIVYDFGLVSETERFPSAADFRFVLFRFAPRWGFRAAFQKLSEIFPDYFRVRSSEQGLWMPFTDISTVHGWQDFGFRYHEGNNNVAWDDAHGILSFRYTEPMTWWMRMGPKVPRTLPEALRVRKEYAAGPKEPERRMARICETAAMENEFGEPALEFREEPWCRGAVWSLNPNPDLRKRTSASSITGAAPAVGSSTEAEDAYNAATVYWNESLKQKLYGAAAQTHLDGEYLDSLEGYVTSDLNFRREHFAASRVPLTFSTDTKRPALFKGLAVFEFTRWLGADVHRLGKLMFANGVPYRFSFLCPCLDVLGTETDWLVQGKYRPAPDATMSLWRTMSGAKPYLLLMNTDFERFTPELVERYFQRSLFYGFFPGMFSHNASDNPYWQNLVWYDRDRPLFKKYVPLIKRVAEAGWQPLTLAECDNPQILVERFGPGQGGESYLTLHNETDRRQQGRLQVDWQTLGLKPQPGAKELLAGDFLSDREGHFAIALEPQQTKVIALGASRSQ